jgi:hypothetical protein
MFTPDVQVLDFTAQDWLRLPDLFRPPSPKLSAPAAANGGILAVREGQRLLKVSSTVSGRLLPPESGNATAAELGQQHDGAFAIVFSTSALEQFGDRFARRLSQGQSFHVQVEAFVEAMRELEREGEVELWPSPFSEWPIPTERAFASALDLVCPDGKSVVMGAFDASSTRRCACDAVAPRSIW